MDHLTQYSTEHFNRTFQPDRISSTFLVL